MPTASVTSRCGRLGAQHEQCLACSMKVRPKQCLRKLLSVLEMAQLRSTMGKVSLVPKVFQQKRTVQLVR